MDWLRAGLHHALIMTWETFWALVLGFAVSAALQAFTSKPQMGRLFGRTDLRSVGLATGLGAASSSCSYAAAAAARSAFKQGAALIPALAFMFASTNLVVELGAVLWLLMGWRFVLAEVVGAFVLIGLMWGLMRLVFPEGLEAEARRKVEGPDAEEAGGCCHPSHGGGHEHGSAPDETGETGETGEHKPHSHGERAGGSRWQALGSAFIMDWQMLWKEIAVGFLLAGFLMAWVPAHAWRALFLRGGPAWLRLLENACVGPLIAVASFVCSVGNIPLASVLWSGGISFGGVVSFLYADLLILPLILIYRKYYGGRTAAYIVGIFFLAMVGAGIVVDLLFTALKLAPTGPRPPSPAMQAHFSWNYTTWLDLLALVGFGMLWALHTRRKGNETPLAGRSPSTRLPTSTPSIEPMATASEPSKAQHVGVP